MALSHSDDLWMTSSDASSSLRLTPRTPLGRKTADSTKSRRPAERSELTLTLKAIIGTTALSASAFSCNPATSSFAICAGSVAILAHVDEKLKITQKLFCARPNTLSYTGLYSSQDSVSGTSTPESRNHFTGSLRRKTFGLGPTRSPQIGHGVSPGKANLHQKTRAASCVSLSSDGTLLAVGEIGYNPRILIFSTLGNGSSDPLTTLTEHTFGVRCLAFSRDSRWLCSVGDSHDGFVYLWTVNPKTGSAKLHSSNKCISSVQDIAWMASSIVTVGTRHVKLWRLNQSAPSSPSKKTSQLEAADTLLPSSPGPRTLHGRNCLLGPLLEATFTCVEAISDSKSALCTERGSICVLDDSDCMQRLYQISTVDFSIKCLSVDYSTNDLLFGGKGADIRRIKLDDLDQLEAFPRKSRSSSTSSSGTASTLDESTGLIALGPLPACLVAVDSAHCVQLYSKTEPQSGWPVKLHEAPAHRSAILGVRMIGGHEFEIPRFFTWSTDGLISIWTLDGIRKADFEVSLNQSYSSDDDGPNELTVVRASDDGGFFIAGDKRGNLRLLEGDSWTSSLEAKAHVGQINDIAIVRHSEDTVLIATCGRDRTIQIFRREPSDLDLIQTIDQHTSSINQLRFLDDGSALLSSSSDRTVVMHTLATADRSMAYISTRIIVLKSTPLSMVIDPKDPNILVVSALDKQIHKFELSSGQQKQTMRLTDKESNELVPLMCLVACLVTGSETSSSVLIGGSPMDKSIRIHDAMTGTIISKAYGHSERISDLAIICRGEGPDGRPLYAIISTSLDKTIMIWDLEYSNTFSTDEDYTSAPLSGTPTVSKPLRRVLSRSSLAEYHRSLEASGISPLSSVKGQSPSRIRKKPSRYSLVQASIASPTSKPVFNSALTRQFQTAPLSPSTPVTKHKRPPLPEFHRTQSANNLSNLTDLNATVEQLYRSLAAFRKKLSATTEQLDPEMVVELQTQLAATLGDIQVKKSDARATDDSTLGQATNGVSKRELVASEEDVDGFLGMYSERLAKMVEQRVMAELTKTTREDNRCQGTGKDRDKNGIDHSPMRDEAGGHGEDEAVAIESEGKG